ncbi:EF-hand domain-containing protein [Nonomuraea pusilla]|uniref:EF-hand domain-containing protein n=1 Tax=Nonomuraea pusilla TaxID=46177 RepID=UPI00332FB08E
MASEFQRRKVMGVFRAMDVDGDGLLTEADFQALARRWTAIAGSADQERLASIMTGWWPVLLAASCQGDDAAAGHDGHDGHDGHGGHDGHYVASGQDGDGGVTLDEVLRVVERLGDQADAVSATADAMFDAIDLDGDGLISRSEYAVLVETWSGTPAATDHVFPRLDLDGDGHLARDEFRTHWTDFWAGDDPYAPGTFVFGELLEWPGFTDPASDPRITSAWSQHDLLGR